MRRGWPALVRVLLLVGAGAAAGKQKPKPQTPPKVTPIAATFVQQDFATYYVATATDKDGDTLTYTWSLKPPKADPGCSAFAVQPATQAVWHHGDQDGCNHQIYGARGHPGIITLKVTDGTFTCTETYFGRSPARASSPTASATRSRSPAGTTAAGTAEVAAAAEAAVEPVARRRRRFHRHLLA